MKLQAISAARIGVANTRNVKAEKSEQIVAPYVVNFRGNPKHVIFYGAEFPDYDKKGGVANVMGYYDKFPDLEKAIVQPYYRARKDYTKSGKYTGNITPHKFDNSCKYPNLRGKYFYSKIDFDKKNIDTETTTNLEKNLERRNLIVLEEIASKDVVYGEQPVQTIRAFKAKKAVPVYDETGKNIIDYKIEELKEPVKNDKGEVVGERIKNHFFVLSKGTAEFKVPYDDGSYSSDRNQNPTMFSKFKPKPYAENNRAFVELKDAICAATKTSDSKSFEPSTVVCSDSQTAYTIAFMRDEAVSGNKSYAPDNIAPSYVIHNLRKGYTGECGGLEMALNLGLSKEDIEILKTDEDFIKAEEAGETSKYFAEYLSDVMDYSGAYNPTKIAFDLRKKDYVTGLNTVSHGYSQDLANNTEIPSALRGEWKELVESGRAVGIMNPFEDPGFHIFNGVPAMTGYTSKGVADIKAKLTEMGDGFAHLVDEIEPFAIVDKTKFVKDAEGKYTVSDEALENLETTKNINKMIFLNRLTSKFDPLITKNKDLYNTIVAGRENWNVNLIGRIDEKLLTKENINNVKVYATWGRLDSQKSLDIVMDAFDKFCQNHPEEKDNYVLVLGGEAPGTAYSEKVLAQAEIMANKYPGHFSFMEAFAPNAILASAAEQILLPSREAPCELTDVETMQYLTLLTATRAQGMDDKNFDPADNPEKATSFKTAYAYFLSQDKIAAFEECGIGAAWRKDIQIFKDKVQNEMSNRIASASVFAPKKNDNDIQLAEYINQHEEHKEEFDNLLEKYRSQILTLGVVASMERGLNVTAKMKKTMFQNQLNLKTGWETNQELTKTGKSSAEMYREIFNTKAKTNTTEYATPYLKKLHDHLQDLKKSGKTGGTNGGGGTDGGTIVKPPKPILKYVAYTAVATAVIGGAAYLLMNNKNSNNSKPALIKK